MGMQDVIAAVKAAACGEKSVSQLHRDIICNGIRYRSMVMATRSALRVCRYTLPGDVESGKWWNRYDELRSAEQRQRNVIMDQLFQLYEGLDDPNAKQAIIVAASRFRGEHYLKRPGQFKAEMRRALWKFYVQKVKFGKDNAFMASCGL